MMHEAPWQSLEGNEPLEFIQVQGIDLRAGAKVRLRPAKGGDVHDLILADKIATIESIEQDYEGKVHLAVVLDDDPGRDLGLLRQPGHRFFFAPEEVDPMPV
jgi:hypothetical protein